MILELMDEAVRSGARLRPSAEIIGLSARTIIRWRGNKDCADKRKGPQQTPSNKLSDQERQKVLKVANSPEYRDLSPNQIVPNLADMGIYLASESTFYRVLREEKMVNHREPSKPASTPRPKEHVATGPCQVWSWDITYLKANVKGIFFYLYMIRVRLFCIFDITASVVPILFIRLERVYLITVRWSLFLVDDFEFVVAGTNPSA